jgi:hypothetical protein
MKKFQCGDLLFVRGKSFISKMVNLFDGEFSHCCIALSDKVVLEAQYFTKTRITPIYFDDYEVVNLGLTNEQRDKILKLGVNLVGEYYDYGQILGILLQKLFHLKQRKFNNPNHMICSELITYLLLHVGYIQSTDEIDKFLELTPNELYFYLKSNKM